MKKAIAAAVLLASIATMGQIPNSKVMTGEQYRLCVTLGNQAGGVTADTTLRFPAKTMLDNTCLPAGFPGFIRPVYWAHIRNMKGSANLNAIIYSPKFPSGVDTLLVTGNVRSVTIGGCKIDSIKILACADTVLVFVTDGTPATN